MRTEAEMGIARLGKKPLGLLIVPISLALLAACRESSTEPIEVVSPALQELRLDTRHLHTGEVVYIVALPADPKYRSNPRQRIPVEVRVGGPGGDHETLTLHPHLCGGDDDTPLHACNEFLLVLAEDADLEALRARAAELPGRVVETYSSVSVALVVIFSGSLSEAISEASSWPGVRSVNPSHVFQAASGPYPTLDYFTVALLAEEGDPTPGDRVLQYRPGDMVEIRYEVPGRDPLVAWETVGN